jgi:hypothetical protein
LPQVLRLPRIEGVRPQADLGHAWPQRLEPTDASTGPAHGSFFLWRLEVPHARPAVRVPAHQSAREPPEGLVARCERQEGVEMHGCCDECRGWNSRGERSFLFPRREYTRGGTGADQLRVSSPRLVSPTRELESCSSLEDQQPRDLEWSSDLSSRNPFDLITISSEIPSSTSSELSRSPPFPFYMSSSLQPDTELNSAPPFRRSPSSQVL